MQPIIELGILDSTSPTVIFTAGEGGASIDVFQLTNVTGSDAVVSVEIGNGSDSAEVVSNYTITPDDNSISPAGGKLFLPEDATITVTASAANAVTYLVNGIGGFFDGA